MSNPKNYINGAFLTKNARYDFINIDFKDEFLSNLALLPKNEKGFRKVTLTAQKADPLKWSVFENTFVPTGGNRGGKDDLPF